jgi:hypothetical protein
MEITTSILMDIYDLNIHTIADPLAQLVTCLSLTQY